MGWGMEPAGLREVLGRVRTDYAGNLPQYVSENGASFRDYLNPAGECRDPERVDFLEAHLREAHRAMLDGAPLQGLFCLVAARQLRIGSVYRERFGLIYVDHPTQRRMPKTSFKWYRDVIQRGGLPA